MFLSSAGIAGKRLSGKVYFEKKPSELGWTPKGIRPFWKPYGRDSSIEFAMDDHAAVLDGGIDVDCGPRVMEIKMLKQVLQGVRLRRNRE